MIDIQNALEGKNLCNIFASLIIEKINSNTPNAISEIKVIDLRNFFIVRGVTTSEVVINPSDIISEFLEKYDKEKSESVRVIDVINYNTTPRRNYLYICANYNKNQIKLKKEGKIFLDSLLNEKLFFNLKLNYDLKTVYYDTKYDDKILIESILKNVYPNLTLEKVDLSNEIYESDRVYGLSDIHEIYYHLLLENISNHLFSLGISKEVNFVLQSNLPFNEIDENNIDFKILNNNHIVNKTWLESLILDVFPFDLKSLEDYFGDSPFNLKESIINNVDDVRVNKLGKISEFVLV